MQQQQASSFQGQNQSNGYQADQDLCTDMLMTEKYVSRAYDTAIFEFRDPQVRQVLNHIQKRRATTRGSDLQLYAEHGHV